MALFLLRLTKFYLYRLMRNLFFLSFLLFPFLSLAQPKGFKPVGNVSAFQQNLAQASKNQQSIKSDFKQTKVLQLLADKVNSSGRFYFQNPDKVRIEYTQPFKYLLVMNGKGLLVKDEQKTNKINASGSKMLQSVNRIMMDCMGGTVFANPDFKTTAFENGNAFLLNLKPVTGDMKKMFQQIDIYLDKAFNVQRLVMTEVGGDYSEMHFSNTQRNIALDASLFKVR